MTTDTLSRRELTTGDAAAVVARSEFYAHMAKTFAFPRAELHAEIKEGSWLKGQAEALGRLPYRLRSGAAGDWRVPADYDRFQSEYIRLFEVGPRGHPPCPLHAGHHGQDRLRTMEELIRFYNFFGLRISPGLMPDHVTVELEFMHFLVFKEAEATGSSGDVGSYLRAQRDFLQRHLGKWWPRLAASMKPHRPSPFYRALVAQLGRYLDAELVYLDKALRTS